MIILSFRKAVDLRLGTTYPHLYRMPVNGNWEQVSQATPSAEGLAVGKSEYSRLTVDCLHRFLFVNSLGDNEFARTRKLIRAPQVNRIR